MTPGPPLPILVLQEETKMITRIAAILLAVLLTGCVTPPPAMPVKVAVDAPYAVTRSPVLDQTSHVLMHLDQKRQILYFQSFGGGGAAVGLLLGPLGVAANVGMIESATKADVARLKDKLDVDPAALFQEVAGAGATVPAADGSSQLRVTPYLYVTKGRDDKLMVASAMLLEQGLGPEKWTGRMMYQLPGAYTFDELTSAGSATQERLRSDAKNGFRELLRHASASEQALLPAERPIKFRSEFFNARFDFELTGELVKETQEVIWLRTGGGIYAVRKGIISVVKPS
jgi:hypothetical protein